ncbi:MAG: hypothetical protein FWD89_02550 [Firmicutes bacterium]|nr:hypothetical protein [Bacillota bacterium]
MDDRIGRAISEGMKKASYSVSTKLKLERPRAEGARKDLVDGLIAEALGAIKTQNKVKPFYYSNVVDLVSRGFVPGVFTTMGLVSGLYWGGKIGANVIDTKESQLGVKLVAAPVQAVTTVGGVGLGGGLLGAGGAIADTAMLGLCVVGDAYRVVTYPYQLIKNAKNKNSLKVTNGRIQTLLENFEGENKLDLESVIEEAVTFSKHGLNKELYEKAYKSEHTNLYTLKMFMKDKEDQKYLTMISLDKKIEKLIRENHAVVASKKPTSGEMTA